MLHRVWTYVGALGLSVALAACYTPPRDACGIRCTDACPDGYTCSSETHACVPDDGTSCPLPPIQFASIGVGATYACGLDDGGHAWCWGDNRFGQLGIGDGASLATTPTRVGDDATQWTALSVGGDHTCALRDGIPWCWGNNGDDQVSGNGAAQVALPAQVVFDTTPVPPPFEQISAGGHGTCAIGESHLWCWGAAALLGDGNAAKDRPVEVMSGGWRAVSVGDSHACAIDMAGAVWCWGDNDDGEDGRAPSPSIDTPMPVMNPPQGLLAAAVSAGGTRTCAIFSATGMLPGQLWCWGENDQQQIGEGLPTDNPVPVRIGMEDGWTAISVGDQHDCGVRAGIAYCWGREDLGGLGDGYWSQVEPFTRATPLGAADEVGVGYPAYGRIDDIGCLRSGTTVQCWGEDSNGELGIGTASFHPTAVEVPAPAGATWAHLVGASTHACAVTSTGAVYCWGEDDVGQVTAGPGYGRSVPCTPDACDPASPTPAPVPQANDVVVGDGFTCVRAGSAVHCWGAAGRTGSDDPTEVTDVAPPSGSWQRLTGGPEGVCGVLDDGSVACWGTVSTDDVLLPTVPSDPNTALHDLSTIELGQHFVCAARTVDRARVCWGDDSDEDLGNGGFGASVDPQAADTNMVQDLAVSGTHACMITTAGGVACWGSNYNNESGQPATLQTISTPTAIAGTGGPLATCTAVALADDHACAICDGQPVCWGANSYAELGRGMPGAADPVAAPVALPPGPFAEVAAMAGGGCALSMNHQLYCWGDCQHGECGDGGRSYNLPVTVGATP